MPRGRPFWIGLALGGALAGFGIAGIARSLRGPELTSYLTWWIAGLAAHDAILAPGAALIGLVLARLLPPHIRPPLQAAGYVSVTVVLATLPLVLGHGRQADNPSLQPNDYTGNVLLVVAVTLAVGAVLALRRARNAQGSSTDA
jgi:hypothetical protein